MGTYDPKAAMNQLHQLRITDGQIARAVGVQPATVRRWRTGAQRPAEVNRKRLQQYVGDLHQQELAASRLADLRVARLERARDLLESAAEQAARQRFVAEMRERDRKARAEREAAAADQQRLADRLRWLARPPAVSVISGLADPFDALPAPQAALF